MNVILSTGILICTGYILGEIAEKARLPRISGYILAGILLNPDLLGIMSGQFVDQTDPLLTISLSVITFSIGGTLSAGKLKKTGKTMLILMLFESLSAFVVVFLLVFLSLYFLLDLFGSLNIIIAVCLVLASLAAPTDPSATLAVIHEYRARGPVSSAMLEIAAFDDVMGIILFTFITAFATLLLGETSVETGQIFLDLGKGIGGALLLGVITGLIFNLIVRMFKKQSEGSLIVSTLGLILLCYGISEFFGCESLIATMTLGVMVTNFNPQSEKILTLIERYTDELIFVIFFSLSGLHLQLASIQGSLLVIIVFIIARTLGKFTGIYAGSGLLHADPKVRKYAAGGLIPQGGIVIGLALLLTKDPAFEPVASTIIGIVIGVALVHEITGPVSSRFSLKKAGEI